MANFPSAVPASLRKPVEVSRFVQNLSNKVARSVLVAGPQARASAISKNRVPRLAHEPEDARLTGVTRSLQRRLLGLNVGGSFRRTAPLPVTRIA